MMEKYKICPYCGEKNAPSSIDCINCGYDLVAVDIVDDSAKRIKSNPGDSSVGARMVKICDCGTKNPPNARKCISCGEDISDILPEVDRKAERSLKILSLDGSELLKLTSGSVVVGRYNELGTYLTGKTFVSNTHCRLSSEEDNYYIEDLKSTNFTFVNNEKITEKTKLSDNDEVSLGGITVKGERQGKAAYFIVKIE